MLYFRCLFLLYFVETKYKIESNLKINFTCKRNREHRKAVVKNASLCLFASARDVKIKAIGTVK